jgi:hypothetical protein
VSQTHIIDGIRPPTRAVLRLLEDAEWSAWSDSEIARRTNVSHTFVASLRPAVTCNVSCEKTYTTKHGTTATMNTANIGRRAEPAYEPEPSNDSDDAPIDPLAYEQEPVTGGNASEPRRRHYNFLQ